MHALTLGSTPVREAAGALQDVGRGDVPLHEDDQVDLPDLHDAGQGAQDADRRDHAARRHAGDDEEARARQLDRGQDVRLLHAGRWLPPDNTFSNVFITSWAWGTCTSVKVFLTHCSAQT